MATCAKCGSKRVIPDGVLFDTTRNSTIRASVGFQKDPTALIFTGNVGCKIAASICCDCGVVELRAADPASLWAQYEQHRSRSS